MESKKLKAAIIPSPDQIIGFMLATILVLLFLIYLKWKKHRRHFDKLVEEIPHPIKPLPIIGHAHLFLGNSQQFLEQIFRLADFPTPSKVVLLHQTFILIKRPADMRLVLNSPKALQKHNVYRFLKAGMGEGLVSAPLQKWKKNRKIIIPTFKQKNLDQFVNVFSKRAVILTDVLKNENGRIIDISKFVFNYALDVFSETVFGLDTNSQMDNTCLLPKAMKRGTEIAWQRMFSVIYKSDFIFSLTKMSKEVKEILKFQNNATEKLIKEKQSYFKEKKKENADKPESEFEEQSIGKVFLEMFIELKETGVKLTHQEIRDEANTFMLGGTDTTATSSSFIFLMLALHKDVQDNVYKEVIDILGYERPINYYDLPNLVYLEKVIKETLRLFPLAPIIVRTAKDDIKLEKYIIPKGAGVVLGIGPMMRSAEYYENPLEFNPERFVPEEIAKRHPYTYLPFSAGPRSCIGMKYAMMNLKTLIATIVRKYSMETTYRSVEDIKLMANIVLKPVKGFPLKLTERK